MKAILDRPLAAIYAALRDGSTTAEQLAREALARHERVGEKLGAYQSLDPPQVLAAARIRTGKHL